MLEVVGNNLANLNTTAFKSSRVIFSDLMYEVQRNSTSASGSTLASTNGVQVGTGSRVSQVDLNFQQGNLEATGNPYDIAIDGGGFLIGMSGNSNFYTRAGTLSVDDNGYLSDPATGNLIKRLPGVGDIDGVTAAFQQAGDHRIYIPFGASVPGKLTEQLTISGNLSSATTGAKAQQLITAPFRSGALPVTLSTKLNDLDNNVTDYITGDKILISGQTSSGGTPVVSELSIVGEPVLPGDPPATTVGDLIDALSTAFPDSNISLNTDGQIVATSKETGPSSLSFSLADAQFNTGRTDLSENKFLLVAKGKNADTIDQTTKIYDLSGASHELNLRFTKQTDGTWDMNATIDPTIGTVLDGEVNGIKFLEDGTYAQTNGTGLGDANLIIKFNERTNAQKVAVSFGVPGTTEVLSQRGDGKLVPPNAKADGYSPGTIDSLSIDANGVVIGQISNGQKIAIAQIAIASFRNTDGLIPVGGNYYQSSLASGDAQVGTAGSGDRGSLRSGQLEGSNVDLALEFTRLIIAQRGFSANARTITVTDQVLQELTSIIR